MSRVHRAPSPSTLRTHRLLTKQHAVLRPLGHVKMFSPVLGSFFPVNVTLVQSLLSQVILGVPCMRWRLKVGVRPATGAGSWASEAETQAIRANTSNTAPATCVAIFNKNNSTAAAGWTQPSLSTQSGAYLPSDSGNINQLLSAPGALACAGHLHTSCTCGTPTPSIPVPPCPNQNLCILLHPFLHDPSPSQAPPVSGN